ncbi:MAG: DUF4136 domain-containing protein [Cyclobacteriaceae bacterium]
MKYALALCALLGLFQFSLAQSLDVHYDKNRDLTVYKTFLIGEGEVITPEDERLFNGKELKKWVEESITEELQEKGLVAVEENADLTVTYIIGAVDRSQIDYTGPFGGTPGMAYSRSNVSDHKESTLVVSLNDKNRNVVWRITGNAGAISGEPKQEIDQIVGKGFRKFSIEPAKTKKKKKKS